MIVLTDDSGYSLVSLSEMLDVHGIGVTSAILNSFRSVHDSATESYLKEKAIDMEVRDLSRTYLAISDDEPKVLGYITISIKCMRVPDENLLSGKTRKSMNIDSRTNIVQSYLIGQLSRSADAPKVSVATCSTWRSKNSTRPGESSDAGSSVSTAMTS